MPSAASCRATQRSPSSAIDSLAVWASSVRHRHGALDELDACRPRPRCQCDPGRSVRALACSTLSDGIQKPRPDVVRGQAEGAV